MLKENQELREHPTLTLAFLFASKILGYHLAGFLPLLQQSLPTTSASSLPNERHISVSWRPIWKTYSPVVIHGGRWSIVRKRKWTHQILAIVQLLLVRAAAGVNADLRRHANWNTKEFYDLILCLCFLTFIVFFLIWWKADYLWVIVDFVLYAITYICVC